MEALDFRVIIHDMQAHPQAGGENIIAGKSSGFCGFLRRYVSQNIVAITGNVRLNRFSLFYVFFLIAFRSCYDVKSCCTS